MLYKFIQLISAPDEIHFYKCHLGIGAETEYSDFIHSTIGAIAGYSVYHVFNIPQGNTKRHLNDRFLLGQNKQTVNAYM